MSLARYLVAFLPGRELFHHHVDPGASIVLGEPVGRVDQHPSNRDILGLHNLSAAVWSGRLKDGSTVSVAPNRTVRVVDGLEVDFGARRGLVLAGDMA